MLNEYPEINKGLIGRTIIIENPNNQPWVKIGNKLTVRNVTNNRKLQFEEIKYAWGCENNRNNKYFRLIIKSEELFKLNLSNEQIFDELDKMIARKEKIKQLENE